MLMIRQLLFVTCFFFWSGNQIIANSNAIPPFPPPVADFVFTPASLTVAFNDLSTGCSPYTYLWDFGDGNTSNFPNPTHTYALAGTYLTCLTVTGSCGTDSVCKSITVPPCPIPQASMITNINGLTVQFTDFSSANPTVWLWSFGDGNTSTSQNPTHTYAAPGTYTVCLGVQSICGSDTICQSVSVGCTGAPTATYVFCGSNLSVQFTYAGSGASTFAWDFGDGQTSTTQNPSHTYSTGATYLVCLIATNACGSDTVCLGVALPCTPVSTNFSSSVSSFTVGFTDQSTGGALLWNWTFGDGGTSSAQNPTHTYTATGTFTVCLTALNACCADTLCSAVIITGCSSAPNSSFTTVATGLIVNFTDITTGGVTSWNWDFGDGTSSTAQNPTHTYSTASTYTICLIAFNACGNDTFCQTITVTCAPPTALFTQSLSGQVISYTDLSTQAPIAWFWQFGDGTTSTQQNPVHSYVVGGTYQVCLTVQNSCGIDSVCKSVNTNCATPNVNFLFTINGLQATFSDLTSNGPAGWLWDFGDGSSATQQNPVHSYAVQGTFIVCLTATNICGMDSACRIVNLNCPPPSASFTQAPTNNVVTFTDNSAGSPTSWQWNFGDGNMSAVQNPVYTYGTPGNFTICLTVMNSCGTHTSCKSLNITCPQPKAGYGYNPNTVYTYSFTDSSVNATQWFWNFGDGTTSTSQNPQHTFPGNGTYLVCVTASNGCLSATKCKTITVLCPVPAVSFSTSLSGNTITYTNTTTGGANPVWLWDFGDGAFSSLFSPTHTYPGQGNWTTCLFATDTCGTDSSCSLTSTIGRENPADDIDILVFPNPANDEVTIEIAAGFGETIMVSVFDELGRTISGNSLPAGGNSYRNILNISDWTSGTYILKIGIGERNYYRKLVRL